MAHYKAHGQATYALCPDSNFNDALTDRSACVDFVTPNTDYKKRVFIR